MSAIVITAGGVRTLYSTEHLQEMVDDPNLFYCADNLPKWLAIKFMALSGARFGAAYDKAIQTIKRAVESPTQTIFNVRSDRPYESTYSNNYELRLISAKQRVIQCHTQLNSAFAEMQNTALSRTPCHDDEDDAMESIADAMLQAEKALEDVTDALKELP